MGRKVLSKARTYRQTWRMMRFGTAQFKTARGRQRRQLLNALLCWLHALVLTHAVDGVDACVMDPFVPFQVSLKAVQLSMQLQKIAIARTI